MTTIEYVKYRRKCKSKKAPHSTEKPVDHMTIGPLLAPESTIREKMEVYKPELALLPSQEMGFLF